MCDPHNSHNTQCSTNPGFLYIPEKTNPSPVATIRFPGAAPTREKLALVGATPKWQSPPRQATRAHETRDIENPL